jgi:hypothetical protein
VTCSGTRSSRPRRRRARATTARSARTRTKKVQKEFKEEFDRNLKIQLELTVGPVTDELRAELQDVPFDDGERVEGLGDEAYATKFDQVIAISSASAVSAKLQNYKGSPTKFPQRRRRRGAGRAPASRLAHAAAA